MYVCSFTGSNFGFDELREHTDGLFVALLDPIESAEHDMQLTLGGFLGAQCFKVLDMSLDNLGGKFTGFLGSVASDRNFSMAI